MSRLTDTLVASRLSLVSAAVLVAASLAVVGCGGGGGDGTSKAEYRKQLQQVDQEFAGQLAATEQSLASARKRSQAVAALGSLVPRVKALAARYESLKPPKGAGPAQARVVTTLRKAAGDMSRLRTAFVARNDSQRRALATRLQADSAAISTALRSLVAQTDG